MSAAEPLYQLEDIDTRIDRTQAALKTVRQRLQSNSELAAAQHTLERLQDELRTVQVHQRTLEAEVEDQSIQIQRWMDQLYGGRVRDPHGLLSLEQQIQHGNEARARLEEELLAVMERVEALEAEVQTAEQHLRELETEWKHERAQLLAEEIRLGTMLNDLHAQRQQLINTIDQPIMSRYERLRQHAGHAVSLVQNGVCQWCRVQIPPRDIQHARGSALVTCTNCARILYVP
jgi:predicted  nucleic acid-binding Zn-ribbon protein